MSKINSAYEQDGNFSDKDFLIGSNGDSSNKATKTYSLKNMQNYLLSGLAPLIGGTMRTTEIVYQGDVFTTYAEVINNLDPTFTVRQYHNVFVSIGDVKALLKLQDVEVGVGCVQVLDSDFVNFPIDFSNVYNTIETVNGTATAGITETREIIVRENYAMATLIESVSAKVETNKGLAEALVQTTSTALATDLEALATQVNTVSASFTNSELETRALVQSEALARANADGALSTRIDTVSASFVDPTAEITAAVTLATSAAVTREQAIATSVNTVSAKVDDNEAKITTTQTAVADINGNLSASYALEVDADGNVASMKLLSDGTSGSSIVFTADSFKIFNGTSDIAPFTVVDGNVIMTGTTVVDTIITPGTGPAIGQPGWNGLSLNQSNDNLLEFRHPNGVLGMELGIIAGVLVLNWYDDAGNLIWKGGTSGVNAVADDALAYSGQITNMGRIAYNRDGVISYEGDISSAPTFYTTTVGSDITISLGINIPKAFSNNLYKVNVEFSSSYLSAQYRPTISFASSYSKDTPSLFYILDVIADTDFATRYAYFETTKTKY